MNYIKLVIFDLDGTLVDSLAEVTAAINYARSVFGLPQFAEYEVKKILGSGRRLIEKAFPGISAEGLQWAHALYLSYSKIHVSTSTRLYPGVVDTLTGLKRKGVFMAIISNKNSLLSRKLLSRLGIDTYFSIIIGPDSLPFHKPSPEPIIKLLRDVSVDANEAIIVGDTISDILSGKMARVVTVSCNYGYGDVSELKDADYHISSLPELLNLPLFAKFPSQTDQKENSVSHLFSKGLRP